MISLKLDSQPFQPTHKSKYFQKKEDNIISNNSSNSNNFNSKTNTKTNEMKTQFGRREKKVVKVTTVYCSHYLKMFKDDNTELPTGCSKEQLDYIAKTQQQSLNQENNTSSPTSSSFKSTQSNKQNQFNQIKRFNSNNSNKHYNNNNNNYYNNRQKKDFHSSKSTSSNSRNSSVNHAQFTSKKKSNDIEILIPTSKPIPIHHPSLLTSAVVNEFDSSSTSSSSLSHSNSNEEFPDVIDKFKQLKHNEIDKEIDNTFNEEDEELNEEIQSIMDQKRRISREKQIFFGKNTSEYQNYLSVIPKDQRRISDPQTPDIEASLSKRKWDRVVRRWRRSLHAFDNVNQQNQVELARALAFRLRNEDNPKKTMMVYSSLPYSSYLVDE